MKRNRKKKLAVNRETLRALADPKLQEAAGGVVVAQASDTCNSCSCSDRCTWGSCNC